MIYIVNKTVAETDSIDINNLSIPLSTKNIVEQNIYKSIIKMGINFLPSQYLSYLIVSFHFCFTTLFLIAPFCSLDQKTFITSQEIEDTKNILKPIFNDNYTIISLNSLKPTEHIINLNLKQAPKK